VTTTRAALVRAVETRLRGGDLESPAADARWIVDEVLGAGIPDDLVSERAADAAGELTTRRLSGEPLQYVLGSWSFRGLDLMVDPRVLIPRPETELTAQVAIDEAVRAGARRGCNDPWRAADTAFAVADLGTGSGAIALALAAELPEAAVWATDASEAALAVARANVAGAGAIGARVRLVDGDWFAALPSELRGSLRVVVANPPYIAEHEVDTLPREVADHEPLGALVSGPTGLEAIERIVADASSWLASGGSLVVELAPHQAQLAAARAAEAGLVDARVEPDLTGRARVLVARAPGGG
jgi:release factor glutamine methyltransferase